MKSVGNLTQFVRTHMLEQGNAEQRIDELCRNFDNLNRSHEAVLKARHQITLLTKLKQDADKFQEQEICIEELESCRQALPYYFAGFEKGLLTTKLAQLQQEMDKTQYKSDQLTQHIDRLNDKLVELQIEIERQGGSRIAEIAKEIETLTNTQSQRQINREKYHALTQKLSLGKIRDESGFYRQQQEIKTYLTEFEAQLEEKQNQQVDVKIEIQNLQKEEAALQDEINSLKKRQNNIPAQMLALRREIANTLALNEHDLPFIGELLQVAQNAKNWEGAGSIEITV
ncbi:hypothetical protein [Facilibium subflavum]|uniref:hypothetical protein n=1 Tax=Facilibium subflavum TaxID=2219058 RepID=UPI000E6549C9|nr:hypothetical protein [Facilibium subflavum]